MHQVVTHITKSKISGLIINQLNKRLCYTPVLNVNINHDTFVYIERPATFVRARFLFEGRMRQLVNHQLITCRLQTRTRLSAE